MSTSEAVNIQDYCRRGALAGGKNLSAKLALWKMLFIKSVFGINVAVVVVV
jgi:hypothetical protein